MARLLRCRDVGMDCDFEVRAEPEEEILQRAAEHLQTVHNLNEIPPEVVAKVLLALGSAGNVRTITLKAFPEADFRKIIEALP
jgi:predicted small metal-binding protein